MKTNWLCKFMRKGFEPPMPFGKTNMVVAANTRTEAIEIMKNSGMVSSQYPKVMASKTYLEVSYHFNWTKD